MSFSTSDKKLFSLREVIWFISLAMAVAGTYFPLKADNKQLKNEVTALKTELKENNLVLINYKLNEIQEDFSDFTGKFNQFVVEFNEYTRESSRRSGR